MNKIYLKIIAVFSVYLHEHKGIILTSGNGQMRILSNSTSEEYKAAKKKMLLLDSQIKLLQHDLDMTKNDISNLVDIMNN